MAGKHNRLNSLDLLPAAAEEDVVWAFDQIRANKIHQKDICEQFNLRLRLKGLGPISPSAFGRAALRTRRLSYRLGEVREIAGALADKFEDGAKSDLTNVAIETIKTMVFEMLENAGKFKANPLSAEMMANYAVAIKTAVQAKKIEAETAIVIEKNFKKKAEEAIERAGAAKGLSPEMREA